MNAVKITKFLVLLIATGLLAFAISGANQSIVLFAGYLLLGVSIPAFLLHRAQETISVIAWAAILLLFAFVFDSDRMMTSDYGLTGIGTALLWAMPVVGLVLRLSFWVIDRLRLRSPAEQRLAAAGSQRSGAKVGKGGTATGAMGKAIHPAYPILIACWLLWPIGTAILAIMDQNRWDRMRYDNSLLLMMFLPPVVVTIGFLLYRHWSNRKTEIDTPV
jgi:hypothetical protein